MGAERLVALAGILRRNGYQLSHMTDADRALVHDLASVNIRPVGPSGSKRGCRGQGGRG
jgi:hypothetical protein